ncbi:hypothetical protein TrST_g7194 [Triparma strigata]|uniref:Uncharacterized protein n=1 Tax=Triparma strigata TaxID=1606541 RepID=A0A9W7ED52_9STRA|nr:hypothetical protein TrST_g7194 [Triparma strigata]
MPHSFKCTLHEPPEEFEAYLMGRKAVPPTQTKRVQSKRHKGRKSNVKFLLVKTLGPEVAIVHWRCDINPLTSCEMIMKFTISREAGGEDGGGIRRIEVEGLEEADLSEEALDKIPQSTAAMKTTRLSVEYGTIFLRPLRFGQTDFCYFAEVGIEEGYDDNRMSGSSRMSSSKLIRSMTTSLSSSMNQSGNKVMSMISSISSSLSGRSGSGLSLTDKRNRNKAGRMFKRLDEVFYRRFEREDVIDKRMTLDFIENLANAPPKTEAEQTQITKSLNLVQEHSVATRLSGTDNDPVEKFYHRVGEGGSGWLLSVANIDVAAKILFAQLWLIDFREFVFRILWKVEDSGEVLVAIESVLDEDHVTVKYGTSHKVVKASVRGLWRLKNVSSRGGASRCEVEFYQRIDAGGVVPTWLVKRKVPEGLSSVQTAVNTFRQDEKIDTAERDDLMSSMQQGLEAETYTEEEEAWIKAISEKYEKSSNGGERTEGFKKLISPDPYVKMESMIEGGSLNMADKSTAGCARAIAIIDASLEECAAFDFIKTSREKRKSHRARRTVTIAARGSILTERIESVEARETVAIRLRSSGQFNTKMDYACMLELGAAGSRALNKAFVERRLDEASSVATYFLRLLQPDQLNERDGEAISHDLLWKTSTSKQRVERVKELMKENRALRNLVAKYSWVPTMMVAASKGKLHMIHTVRTKAECVSEKEAAQIGDSLSAALMTEQLMEAGVRLWIMENRPLKEISSELIWFEPFIVVLGKGIVKTAAWGLMWRVILGTFLSMGDLITDILVLKEFWEGGEEMLTYRNLSIVGLVMSMALQIFLVTFNYRHYDFDTRPSNRVQRSEFYGYVNDSPVARASAFALLTLMSSCQVFLRSTLIVMLALISSNLVWIWIAGDMSLFLLLKVLTGDFTYWIRMSGAAGIIISLIQRIVVKATTDFTGCVQMRHPQELGGMYFSVNYFIPLVGLIVILTLKDESTFENETIDAYLQSIVYIVGLFLLTSVAFFVVVIRRAPGGSSGGNSGEGNRAPSRRRSLLETLGGGLAIGANKVMPEDYDEVDDKGDTKGVGIREFEAEMKRRGRILF